MAKKDTKHLGLRIDTQTHRKLRYVAAAEGRSCNGEVLFLLRHHIEEYEKEHGPIPAEEEPES